MTSKIYAYLGKNQAFVDIPTGPKGSIKVEFKGGDIFNAVSYQLATSKSITDPSMQDAIENSPMFGNTIILYSQNSVDENKVRELEEFPDVTDFASAAALLKSRGAKASQLKSIEGVRTLATNMGVSFPNWN